MTCRNILRTTLVAIAILTLVAAPAVAATAATGNDAPRAVWTMDLGALLERAFGTLVFGGRTTPREAVVDDRTSPPTKSVGSESCEEECSDGGSDLDPNG